MASNKPKSGRDFVLLVDMVGSGVLGDMVQLTHQTSTSLDRTTDVAEVTTKDTSPGGSTVHRAANSISWAMSADGVMSFFNSAYEKLEDIQEALETVFVAYMDKTGAIAKFGEGIIETLGEAADVEGFATFSISISGTGALTTVNA